MWIQEHLKLKKENNERYGWKPIPPQVPFYRDSPDHEQYPCGAADIVGYWAKSKIFGGDGGETDGGIGLCILPYSVLEGISNGCCSAMGSGIT